MFNAQAPMSKIIGHWLLGFYWKLGIGYWKLWTLKNDDYAFIESVT